MRKRIYEKLKQLWDKETDPQRLSLSIAVSIYVAFLPAIGFHTLIAFALGWLLGLNGALIFALSHIVHNPLTALFIYAADYSFGEYLIPYLNIPRFAWNPEWLSSINNYLATHIGFPEISLAAFLIGGNCLALLLSVIMYPVIRFSLYLYKKHRAFRKDEPL
jgi:uncharacterized protein (DUF2062 family)